MRALSAFAALFGLVFLAAPAHASAEPVQAAPCTGGLCDPVNDVCGDCIPQGDAAPSPTSLDAVVSAETRCAGPVCDAINVVCQVAFKAPCVR